VITGAGGHTREPGEAPAHSPCLAEVTSRGPYRCGGRRRYPSPESAPLGRAAVAAFGDEAGGRFGGFTDVLDLPLCRRPPQAGSGYGREAGCWRPQPAPDASRPWVCVLGKCLVLLLFYAEFFMFLALIVGIFVRPQVLRSFKLSLPPILEDAADRTACRLAAEKDKEKKDAEKARAHETMRAREALEKHSRRQARDGLPLESSPDTPNDNDDDDDDDEDDDMAARLGLSSDPRLSQRSSSQHPGGLAPPTLGAGTSGSWSEERRRAEGVLDPLVEIIGVALGVRPNRMSPKSKHPCRPYGRLVPQPSWRRLGRPPPRRLGHPRWKRRRSRLRGNLRQRLRRPGPEGSPRRHDWPCLGAGKYLRIPLLQFFCCVS
jgi:hypothetical protein